MKPRRAACAECSHPSVSAPRKTASIAHRVATPAAGSLPAGTYYYKVVARKLSNQGRIAASVATAEASATLDDDGAVTISWTPVATAQEYLVYGRTANTQSMFWTTTDPFFTDAGQAGDAGKPGNGTKWSVKNSFELKNAQDVLIENNVFENVWVADQPGFAIVLTPRNQSGRAPWAVVQRVMFRSNVVRHVAGGVNFLGTDNLAPSQRANLWPAKIAADQFRQDRDRELSHVRPTLRGFSLRCSSGLLPASSKHGTLQDAGW